MLDSILNRILFIIIILTSFSCEDAEFELDNVFDPDNLGLDAPALFFHPTVISAEVGDTIEVDLYSYQMDPASAGYLKIKYTQTGNNITLLNVQADDFFKGDNEPIIHWEEEQQSYIDIQIYYLPDMNSQQANGGTWSLAKVQFEAQNKGEIHLKYITAADSLAEVGPYTELRKFNNQSVNINDYGTGLINVE